MSHSEFSASESASRTTPLSAARRRARRFVLQALYQWHVTKTPSHEIMLQFRTDYDMKRTDTGYFRELLENIPLNLREIDEVLQEHLDHPLDEYASVARGMS